MTTIDTYIPNLKIENNEDGTLTLESEWTGNIDRVSVHHTQVRYLAECLGITREVSALEAHMEAMLRGQIAELQQDRKRLHAYLLALSDRSETLFKGLCSVHAMAGEVNIGVEVAQCAALADIASLACADFEDQLDRDAPADITPIPSPKPTQTQPTTATAPRPSKASASIERTATAQSSLI
jgi:hypothetical protein